MSYVFTHTILIFKKTFDLNGFIIKNLAKKDIKHAFLYVLGPETNKNAWLMSFPAFFCFAKNMMGEA